MKKKRIAEIKLIVYDFDGVMTDNRMLLNEDGSESVFVNRSDGLAVSKIKQLGIMQLILSTEMNNVVQKRAQKLGIDCLNGIDNKKNILSNYCKKNTINLSDVAYVGNDLNDFEVMRIVGLSICPSDSAGEIKEIASILLETNGGYGCVREIYGLLISTNRKNKVIVKKISS